jgi:hypothetical protein
MKKIIMLALLTLPAAALAEEWKGAAFIDAGCSGKMKADTDKHTTDCALKCADTGFGLVLDGKFVKFDDAGNKQALAELKKTKKKDHLRATVTGTRTGDEIKVQKVSLD